jgi:hypothetical protein
MLKPMCGIWKKIMDKNKTLYLIGRAVHMNLIHRRDKDMARTLSGRGRKEETYLRPAKRNNAGESV